MQTIPTINSSTKRINMPVSERYVALIEEATKVDNKIRVLFNNLIREMTGGSYYSPSDQEKELEDISNLISIMTYFTNTIDIENANEIIMMNRRVNRLYRLFDGCTWQTLVTELAKFSKTYLDIILPYTGVNLIITNIPYSTSDNDEIFDLLNDETDIVFSFFGSKNTVFAECLNDREAMRIAKLLNRDVLGMGYFKSQYVESMTQNRICIESEDEEYEVDRVFYFNIAYGAIVELDTIKRNNMINRSINKIGINEEEYDVDQAIRLKYS